MRTILMVAFHFPPFRGSSGIQRTLRFAQYLPAHGWRPIVLTASPRAYPRVGGDRSTDLPPGAAVVRAFSLDAARHLAVGGRYPKWLAMPDRFSSWWLGAVPAGLRSIRRQRPDVLWSTYPIATAHLIGLTLHAMTGIPWIADFRDAMTEDDYPPDPTTRSLCRKIEALAVKRCSRAVFTAPGTRRMYAERYPGIPESRWLVIENGFDEEAFVAAAARIRADGRGGRRLLVHSGVLYPAERDPLPFFAALAGLRDRGAVSASALGVVLRASGDEPLYQRRIDELGLGGIVKLEAATSYLETLAEMMTADGLLIFQGSICNHQIPAKLYEYVRAGRPMLALTDPAGDTAGLLRAMGVDTIVRMDSAEEIAKGLADFLGRIERGEAHKTGGAGIESMSREARCRELAALLATVAPEA
jgi:hypothetical protein